ncbi:hypothetical protein EIP75_21435 [Aquabacterium soli]|uniref:Uncharacterized protein n=1 Tax=Aquabacterium soli TaxID=2493092 RepID=A0A3R8RZZ9_9BURK|nr:hypothetical protein [Aquabacterium soli]RRS01144.1 hypothetical protein EIP75_21435 [Aquabacterium soli]
MKPLKLIIAALVFALALIAPPAFAGSLLAGAGVLWMVGPVDQVPRAQVSLRPAFADEVRVYELEGGAGVVVFKTVNGKLCSRCYRAGRGAS